MVRSVALDEHFEKFVADQVVSGKFSTADQVVQAGLQLLEERELRLLGLRALIDAGDQDYAAGRYKKVENTGDLSADIVSRGRARARTTSSSFGSSMAQGTLMRSALKQTTNHRPFGVTASPR